MKVRKKNRFLLILLSITLVLAIAVTGFGWPGYLLGLIPAKAEYSTKVSRNGQAFAEGNSKAFSVQPVKGVTVSAKENALDKDRKIKMEEVSDEVFYEVAEAWETGMQEIGSLYRVWEFDAGLSDDELLPGTFDITFDLQELGIDEELYDNAHIYRIDDEGKWYEFAASRDGSKIEVHSKQNSILAVVGTMVVLSPLIYEVITAFNTDAYFMPETRIVLNKLLSMESSIDRYTMSVDGVERFKIILDIKSVKEMIFEKSSVSTNAIERITHDAVVEAINSSNYSQELKKDFISKVPEKVNYTGMDEVLRKIMRGLKETVKGQAYLDECDKMYNRAIKIANKMIKENMEEQLEADPEYQKYKQFMKDLASNKESLDKLKATFEQVAKVCQNLEKAYKYLKEQTDLKMPSYVMEIHLSDAKDGTSAGVTNFPLVGNPYVVVYMHKIASGSDTSYDDLTLTLVHELFHAVEREYVNRFTCNYAFDEMLAQTIEWDAYNYFCKDPGFTRDGHDENLKNYYYFAVCLDEYSTTYPEGQIGCGEDLKLNFNSGIDDISKRESYIFSGIDKATVSYPKAGFIIYLKSKFPVSYNTIMTRYKASGKGKVSTILKSVFSNSAAITAFGDKGLSFYFYKFAQYYENKFYSAAESNFRKVFSPDAAVTGTPVKVSPVNKDYDVRVRRLIVSRNNKDDKQYALYIQKSNALAKSDLKLFPMKSVKDKDYVELQNGIFIKPKDFPADLTKPSDYIMEVDGGTDSETATSRFLLSDPFYWVYLMTALPEPKMENENNILTIEPFVQNSKYKNVVDSVIATITLNGKTIYQEQRKYSSISKEWKIDLSKLSVDDKPLTAKQKKALQITFQECIKDTWDKNNPEKACLGPGEPIRIPPGFDITGTYKSEASLTDITLGGMTRKFVGGIASIIARGFGVNPSQEDLDNAIDNSVEVQNDAVQYEQTITITSQGNNSYSIEIQAPDMGAFIYKGTLDDDKVLKMQLKSYSPLHESQDSLDVADDLLGNISLQFKQDEEGNVYIDGSCDIESNSLNATYHCSGHKIDTDEDDE